MTQAQFAMLRSFERAFCVIALLFLMNALEPYYSNWVNYRYDTDTGAGNWKFQAVSLSIYSVGILIALTDFRRMMHLVIANYLVFALVGVGLLSSLWSVIPDASFRRAFALLLTTLFALYLVMRFTPREFLTLLAWALLIACVQSFFFALFTWWGTHTAGPHRGIWRGAFTHKNELGRYMAVGVILFILLLTEARGFFRRILWWSGLAMSAVLLLMSQSRTALVLALGLIAIWPLLKALRAGRFPMHLKFPIVLIFGFGSLVLLLINYIALGLETLGRDTTLTGRTKIWEAAIRAGLEQPWLGSGYRAFWTDVGARDVYARIGWFMEVGNGHNGYLDVWLELGFLGLGLVVALIVVVALRVWRRLITSRDIAGMWYALIFIFLVVYSMPERVILEQSNLAWVLFLTSAFYLTPTRLGQVSKAPAPYPAGGSPAMPFRA